MFFGVEFDPDSRLDYGTWFCPGCRIVMYGGGEFSHKAGCELIDRDDQLVYRYVQRELNMLKQGKRPPVAPLGLLDAYLAAAARLALDRHDSTHRLR